GIGPSLAKSLRAFDAWDTYESILLHCEGQGHQLLGLQDAEFPKRLKELPDGPLCLFKRGAADLNAEKMVGIVGTRRASAYGISQTKALVRSLQSCGATVVSGLA